MIGDRIIYKDNGIDLLGQTGAIIFISINRKLYSINRNVIIVKSIVSYT